jgi:hypothetical protein
MKMRRWLGVVAGLALVGTICCAGSRRILTADDIQAGPVLLESGKEYDVDTSKTDLSRISGPTEKGVQPLSAELKPPSTLGPVVTIRPQDTVCTFPDCNDCFERPNCCICCSGGFPVTLHGGYCGDTPPPIKCQ